MTAARQLEDGLCRPRHYKPSPCAPIAPDSPANQVLETCRGRLLVAATLFALLFVVVAVRLALIVLVGDNPADARLARTQTITAPPLTRADIVDRNGALLATTLDTQSLYANPRQVPNPAIAATELVATLPDLDAAQIRRRLSSAKSFVWIKRHLTPREQYDVNRLGIPGLDFEQEEQRVYPLGDLAAHVVGYCGIDKCVSGVERGLDPILKGRQQPLRLALDARVQFILREELKNVVDKFTAKGAAGIIMNAKTGEIVAMVSLPDFDPNHPPDRATIKAAAAAAGGSGGGPLDESIDPTFDKVTFGDYELGSVFKIFNTAMALDSGVSTMTSDYDALHPIHIGRFTITDYHGKHRWLSVPEIFMYSSNLGSARMAVAAGADRQKAFLQKLGLLTTPKVELDEVARPQFPRQWREVNTMTIAFGHGISVSPLAAVTAVCAIVNGGILRPATFLKLPPGDVPAGVRVIQPRTSDEMRKLMRLVVEHGTARFAEAPGYVVGGKTGTAEKNHNGHYLQTTLVSNFIGAFPMNDPKYVILTLIDEPHGNKESHGYATAGWTAAPAAGRIITRIAPLLGVAPVDESSPAIVDNLAISSLQGKHIEDY